MNDRLYRSRNDRIIAGVAGGLADQFRLDPSIVRVVWLILVIPTGGLALLLYVAMALVVPEEPAGDAQWGWDRGREGAARPDGSPTSNAGPTIDAPAGATAAMGSAGGPSATSSGSPGVPGEPVGPATGGPALPDPSSGAAAGFAGGPAAGSPGRAWSASSAGSSAGLGDPNAPLGAPAGLGSTQRPPDPRADSRSARADARAQRHAAYDARRAARREHHDGTGALLGGLILILVGGFFLVRQYAPAFDVNRAWPVLIVLIGVVLLVGSVRRSNGPSA